MGWGIGSRRFVAAALAWTAVLALAVVVTVREIIYPEVHWAVAMPQVFQPIVTGSSDAVTPDRLASPHGHALAPGTKVAAAVPSRPAKASRPAGAAGGAPAHQAATLKLRWRANPGSVRAFSPDTHYMSLPAYVRYVVHEQTGRWITYAEAVKMVKDKTIPVEAAAVTP